MINWDKATREDINAIRDIVNRACEAFPTIHPLNLEMDLTAAHLNEPLDLDKLEGFDDGDFFHDIFGIASHIDRSSGRMTDCFLPRCSA